MQEDSETAPSKDETATTTRRSKRKLPKAEEEPEEVDPEEKGVHTNGVDQMSYEASQVHVYNSFFFLDCV